MEHSLIRVGITGHLDLTATTVDNVAREIRKLLASLCDPVDLVGVTCLARGADTVFAQQVIALGGRLEAIIPSSDYPRSQLLPSQAGTFNAILDKAASVRWMPAHRAGDAAYVAANNLLLDSVGQLIAVWDGHPNGGAGGTAAVVRDARARDIPVIVIWPEGSQRESNAA